MKRICRMSPELREAIEEKIPDYYYPIPERLSGTQRELTDPLDEEVSFTLTEREACERVFFIGEVGVDWTRYLVAGRVRLVPEVRPSYRQSLGGNTAMRDKLDRKLLRALKLKAFELELAEAVVAVWLPGEYGQRDETFHCFLGEAREMLREFDRKNERLRKKIGSVRR